MRIKKQLAAAPLLLLLISMAWPRDSRSEDTPLSESARTELCFPGSDAQRLLRIEEEAPLKIRRLPPGAASVQFGEGERPPKAT